MASWQFVYAKRFAFYPPDYDDPGLGGAEAVLIVLTRSLARLGHDVVVYNCCYRPGMYDGVAWRPLYELPDAIPPDVRVSVRYEESVTPVPEARNVFWMLDNRPEGAAYFLNRLTSGYRRVVVASRAMAEMAMEGGVRHSLQVIPHPVETRLYPLAHGEQRPPVCLYTSIPDRGLDVALTVWPRIRAAVPTAELHVTSGYELWGFARAEAAVLNERITEALHDLVGVCHLGVVNRARLRQAQCDSALLLYPCREQEMFCLAVAEAAAAGTPAVTSATYALTERVQDGVTGVLIHGDIDKPEVQDRFVHQVTRLLTDPQLRSRMGSRAQTDVRRIDAEAVARLWETIVLS